MELISDTQEAGGAAGSPPKAGKRMAASDRGAAGARPGPSRSDRPTTVEERRPRLRHEVDAEGVRSMNEAQRTCSARRGARLGHPHAPDRQARRDHARAGETAREHRRHQRSGVSKGWGRRRRRRRQQFAGTGGGFSDQVVNSALRYATAGRRSSTSYRGRTASIPASRGPPWRPAFSRPPPRHEKPKSSGS